MRTLLVGVLLLTVACRRPSQQLAAMLTPTTQPNIANYDRFLKAGDELVAGGNDPAWLFTINPSKGTMRFKVSNGDSITTPIPERQTDSDGAFRYKASSTGISVLFRPDSCVDKLSRQRYDYYVEIDVKGKTYIGCGSSLRQLALLQDIWVLTDFKGQPITASNAGNELPRLEISLTENHVTGTTGCNRLNGSVKADTRQLIFGPLATTRMACAGEAGAFESKFLAEFLVPLTYRITDGKLILLHSGQPVMSFKKVD